MSRRRPGTPVGLLMLAAVLLAEPARAQQPRAGEWAWKTIVEQDSVAIRYIFYREADNENNGVVLRVDNAGSRTVSYRFTAIFRAAAAEGAPEQRVEEVVAGALGPRTSVTGDADGLFFIPFPDGREVSQIGLRGLRIRE